MTDYDAIVIGARVAGSPTAMLLARQGYRVLAVDRATFPSDTLSTLVVHAPGIAALHRWGLLDRLIETGCPPIDRYSFDLGPFTISGRSRPVDGIDLAYAPRRTVLDALLVGAAREAGAEVREGQNVDGLVMDADGSVRGIHTPDGELTARIVIGADGRNSHVAKAVRAEEYHTKPRLQYSYYTYFSGLPTHGMETYIRPDRGFACIPTHDDLTLIVLGWPYAEARAYKADVPGNFRKTLELVPEVAARVAKARQVAPFLGGAVPGWFRKPYGPGWALVGDAGYTKDPITAQGITDAFLDAERCSDAVDRWLGEGKPYDDVMGAWHQERDAKAVPIYEFTAQMASLEPPPPELEQLLGAVAGNPQAMDGFVSVVAGSLSPGDFFSEENVARIFAAHGSGQATA
jgi:2-polyprenyl-6-methoxyphenol hydroxylase-like FAD-dependent oxidoreductase